jgi:hypothetical protein
MRKARPAVIPWHPGDWMVLCSDGVSTHFSADELGEGSAFDRSEELCAVMDTRTPTPRVVGGPGRCHGAG